MVTMKRLAKGVGLLLLIAAAACSGNRVQVTLDGAVDAAAKEDGHLPKLDGQPPKAYRGSIWLEEFMDLRINMPGSVDVQVGFVTGSFFEVTFVPSATFGTCKLGDLLAPPPGLPNFVDGGKVSISGCTKPLTFTFQKQGYYDNNLGTGAYGIFSKGQTLGIKGSGGGVIATPFSASLATPDPLRVTAPLLDRDTNVVDLNKDWTVRWTAGQAARVRVTLRCSQTSKALICDSTDDGQEKVTTGALKALAAIQCTAPTVEVERINEIIVPSPHANITARAAIRKRGGVRLQ